ncbi:MAG: hypothetical protein ABI692_12740, partial [Terracoccus sp.]
FAAGAEQAKESAGPRVEHAQKVAHRGGDRAKDAYSVLKGEAVAKPKGGGRTKWLIGIGLTAAAVAAVAAWRRQQSADDPWATPLNDGTANRAGGTSTSSSLKDKASEQVDHAKEAIGDATDKAKDRADGLAAKGQSALADAKDRSGDQMDDATNKTGDLIADAKAKAEDAKDEAGEGASDGELTEVDGTLGTDAGDGDAAPKRVGGEFGEQQPN